MTGLGRTRSLLVLAGAALLVAAIVLLTVRRGSRAPEPGELAARTTREGRLIVVGLDALDWQLVDELSRRGAMPSLQRLVSRGASAVLEVPPPLLSPVVWTTIATGAPPAEHGVLDFLEEDARDGSPRPVSSRSRKVPALWEMTAAAGRSTAVIGWWATFPADAVPRCAIYSDRLTEQLLGLSADAAGAAAPAAAAAAARRLHVGVDQVTPAMLAPYGSFDPSELAAVQKGDLGWEDPVGGLARLVAATTTVERITDDEIRRGTEVILTYVEGTDTVGHLFGAYRPPPTRGAAPELAKRFAGTVDAYYAGIDAWVGRIAASLGPNDTIVIVSDHGFTWGEDRPPVPSGTRTPTAVWWHKPEGVFLAAGPGIRRTTERQRLGILDVAPALLAFAGLPPDANMRGSVPPWLFEEGSPAGTPKIAFDYRSELPRRTGAAADLPPGAEKEALAKLRALGYLGAGGERTEGTAPAGNRVEARRLNNAASADLAQGRLEQAEAGFRRAIAADPAYAAPRYNLSLLHRKRGFFDDADREFWGAVERGIADPEMTVVRLALDYRERGDPRRAAAVFAKGRRRFPGSAPIWLNSGVFLGEQRDYAGARECLKRATELDPGNAAAWTNLGIALASSGDAREARRALTKASRLDPGNDAVRRELARLGGPLE